MHVRILELQRRVVHPAVVVPVADDQQIVGDVDPGEFEVRRALVVEDDEPVLLASAALDLERGRDLVIRRQPGVEVEETDVVAGGGAVLVRRASKNQVDILLGNSTI